MNLPNKLTVARIAMIPVFIVFYFVPMFEWHRLCAMTVFALASFTDFLDGYIARKNNLVTNLGKFLDPIADKMLVACALIAVCVSGYGGVVDNIMLVVFTMIILCRELLISGFRIVAADKGVVLAADKLGKIKTVLQMTALIVLLPVTDFAVLSELCGVILYWSGFGILAAATIMTVTSCLHYIIKNKAVLQD